MGLQDCGCYLFNSFWNLWIFFFFPSLINIFRVFYPTTEKYTFFSSVYGTYMKIDQTTDHETNLFSILVGMLLL